MTYKAQTFDDEHLLPGVMLAVARDNGAGGDHPVAQALQGIQDLPRGHVKRSVKSTQCSQENPRAPRTPPGFASGKTLPL